MGGLVKKNNCKKTLEEKNGANLWEKRSEWREKWARVKRAIFNLEIFGGEQEFTARQKRGIDKKGKAWYLF